MESEDQNPGSRQESDGEGNGTGNDSPSESPGLTVTIPRWFLILSGIFTVFLISGVVTYLYVETIRPRYLIPQDVMDDLGLDGVVMFRQHDRNGDGVLDIIEFEPLAHRLLEMNITHDYRLEFNVSDEVVTLKVHFTPLDLDTLSKDIEERPSGLDTRHGLRRWKKPVKEKMNLATHHFKAFLPKDSGLLGAVGEVYNLIEVPEELEYGAAISSNRYVPPYLVAEPDILIHKILNMVHRYPFVLARFKPHGSVAVVRAYNQETLDISFRIHAEFQLNDPPFNPFWFTPGQFRGNLIIDRDLQHVHKFQIYVPNTATLNVDMEWITGDPNEQNMEVDIGYLPLLVINSTAPSQKIATKRVGVVKTTFINETESNAEQIQWTEEIPEEEAFRKLEVSLYAFKKVTYHNISDAFEIASKENKLVHHILLWGALDDQSC